MDFFFKFSRSSGERRLGGSGFGASGAFSSFSSTSIASAPAASSSLSFDDSCDGRFWVTSASDYELAATSSTGNDSGAGSAATVSARSLSPLVGVPASVFVAAPSTAATAS